MSGSGRPVETVVAVDTQAPGAAISPDLSGAFFEDLDYAADGGLHAERLGGRDSRTTWLRSVDDGVGEDLGERVLEGVESGRRYDLRVEVDGPRVRCFRDGEPLHDVEDVRPDPEVFAVPAVRGSAADEVIVKIVNTTPEPVTVRLRSADMAGDTGCARTALTVAPDADSRFGPAPAAPVQDRITGPVRAVPPHSFTVLRTDARPTMRGHAETADQGLAW